MRKLPIFLFLLFFWSAIPRVEPTTKEILEKQVIDISVLNIEAQQLNREFDEKLIELKKLESKIE